MSIVGAIALPSDRSGVPPVRKNLSKMHLLPKMEMQRRMSDETTVYSPSPRHLDGVGYGFHAEKGDTTPFKSCHADSKNWDFRCRSSPDDSNGSASTVSNTNLEEHKDTLDHTEVRSSCVAPVVNHVASTSVGSNLGSNLGRSCFVEQAFAELKSAIPVSFCAEGRRERQMSFYHPPKLHISRPTRAHTHIHTQTLLSPLETVYCAQRIKGNVGLEASDR